MNQSLLDQIADKRNMFLVINYALLILYGGLTFPVTSLNDFLYIALIIFIYVLSSVIFYGLYSETSLVTIFFTIFLLNVLGLSWRVLLEWGEHSLMANLTILNISIHLISIPLFVALGFYIIQQKNRGDTR
ncbi:hypothetical protein ACTWQB_00780 [Piscibacillus sp. B03]|uniref:hypothetical protein n=1 Tax=Piscibacillus sp. B03 TaxID=3457430 RepID=UPI003FCCB69D